MKETPRRRITVTSLSNELFTDKLGNRVFGSVGGRGAAVIKIYRNLKGTQYSSQVHKYAHPTPSYSRLLNRDDVNGFSSTSNICCMRLLAVPKGWGEGEGGE
jgi:hypothetical protein